MEWEIFAVTHANLFVQRAKEREEKEQRLSASVDIPEPDKRPLYLMIGVASLVVLIIIGAVVYRYVSKPSSVRVHDLSPQADPAATEPAVQKPAVVLPMKRDPRPEDDKFSGNTPPEKELNALWDRSKKKLSPALNPLELKEEMDKYLPALQTCFNERAKAGDKNLRGSLNMKIRVAGSGKVLDVLFPDEKYKATIFSDCIGAAIKAQPFRLFRSQSQTFTYYYEL
jgi:hypothetical protein